MRLILCTLAALVVVPSATARTMLAADYIITPNEVPAAGLPLTFTATYPQSARQRYGSRQHANPQVELVCNGEIAGVMPIADEKRDHDTGDWVGVSYPILIPADATSCSAVVYSYDKDGLIAWATVYFNVTS